VISSHIPKIVFGGLLILTISIKISVGMNQFLPEQGEIVRTHFTTFLMRQGFEPDRVVAIENPITVSGHSGGCKLSIVNAELQGWHQYIIRRLASDGDQIFYLFRGRRYKDQPIWLTRLSSYWTGAIRTLGLTARSEPFFGIVASPTCDLDSMPWQELGEDVAVARP
jgi:hypothetical protein